MAAPPPELVSTETPVNSTTVLIEVNNVPATSVDLGIGDASARQDSMSIARKAHEETTAKQDSMSIAGIVSQEDATARRDSMSIAGTAYNENHLAIMTDSPTSQGYAIHDESNARRQAKVKDASAPMGYANVDNSRAIYSSASYPNHIISLASEGDTSDENDHHHCKNPSGIKVKFKEESKSIQLPIMQASKFQVLSIERNGYLLNPIGKSTPSSAISRIQPCNFSSTEHSVTRLRGRVLVSSTEDQRRGSILTSQRPRDYARDLMSMAKCQNCKAQDYIPETLWYKGIKGNALCQRLFYWLVSLRTAPQDGITNDKLGQFIAKWKSVRRKKTPRKSSGKTDYANFASLAQSLIQFQISTLNIKRSRMVALSATSS